MFDLLLLDHLGRFLKYINDPLKMGHATAESKKSKYSNYAFKSLSHRVLQLIIHVCHTVTHKHTPRQVSLSAARHVFHLWDCQSLFPWWQWTKQHVCIEKNEQESARVHAVTLTTHTWTFVSLHSLCSGEVVCLYHSHKLQHAYKTTHIYTHTDKFLIASNSQHVHASLVCCCLVRGVSGAA